MNRTDSDFSDLGDLAERVIALDEGNEKPTNQIGLLNTEIWIALHELEERVNLRRRAASWQGNPRGEGERVCEMNLVFAANSLARAILDFIEKRPEWTGLFQETLERLDQIANRATSKMVSRP